MRDARFRQRRVHIKNRASWLSDRAIYSSTFGGAKQKRLYRRWRLALFPPMPGYPSTERVVLPPDDATGAWVHP